MSDNVEIVIKDNEIRTKSAKLKKIAEYVQNKRIDPPISRSLGKTVDEMNNLMTELNLLAEALGTYMKENAVVVEKIAVDFTDVDLNLAADFSGKQR